MAKEIVLIVVHWMLTHMPKLISRLFYPDLKVVERVRVCLKGGSVSVVPDRPIVQMTLEIRNSLASPIKLQSIHGDVASEGYILINNFTKILAKSLDKQSDKSDFSITLDLPDAKASIARNHRADTILLSLNGTLSFNAIGRELTNPIRLSMYAELKGLRAE